MGDWDRSKGAKASIHLVDGIGPYVPPDDVLSCHPCLPVGEQQPAVELRGSRQDLRLRACVSV